MKAANGRIAADPRLPAVRLPGPVLNELRAHARQSCPEECCGLLTGDSVQRFRRAWRCGNDMNSLHQRDPQRYPRDARHAFHMNPIDYQRVERAAEAEGQQVNGVYHSHVDVGAYFSELDQEYAGQEQFPFPDADHFVVAVVQGDLPQVKEIAVFRWSPEERRFVGRSVEASAP